MIYSFQHGFLPIFFLGCYQIFSQTLNQCNALVKGQNRLRHDNTVIGNSERDLQESRWTEVDGLCAGPGEGGQGRDRIKPFSRRHQADGWRPVHEMESPIAKCTRQVGRKNHLHPHFIPPSNRQKVNILTIAKRASLLSFLIFSLFLRSFVIFLLIFPCLFTFFPFCLSS